MTAFFVRTDRSVAGPLTGVELREAALAGILRHDGIVGGSPEGPWFLASDVGLFSEKKTPLPHPPDTHVPQYQVRGMPGAFQGPFKLRELIGFAARGMLPAEALLQSDDSDEWIEVKRYRVLAAVLGGELVLIDESGKVIVRNAMATAVSGQTAEVGGARAPIMIAKSADMTHATSLAPAVTNDDDFEVAEAWGAPVLDHIEEDSEREPSMLSQRWSRLRASLPDIEFSIPPRLAIQFVCLVVLFVGVASAVSYWKQIGLQREQVLGRWIVLRSSGQPAVGLSLRQDGGCVIFNTQGQSWTGDFVWDERKNDVNGFEHIAPFSTVFAQINPAHEPGAIAPTDGYIRLQGFVKKPPQIDGQEIRDLFLRRTGDRLRIGYLASVHWTEDAKRMEAGWLTAIRHEKIRPDIAADLRKIEKEVPVPIDDFAGEMPLHVSEAIVAIRKGIPTKVENEEIMLHETLAYSIRVNSAYLLERYGLPDEARRIFRFEIPKLRNGPSFDAAQVVQYGDLQFILAEDGQLRYVALVKQVGL